MEEEYVKLTKPLQSFGQVLFNTVLCSSLFKVQTPVQDLT